MSGDISRQCEVVANNFQWWAKTAEKYLQEDSWTEGRIKFVEERFSIYERVQNGLQKNDYKLTVPGDVKATNSDLDFRILMSVMVSGFRSKEYVHLIGIRNHLMLYRTKSKGNSFPQGCVVRGKLYPHSGKTLFAGVEFPAIRKATLVLKD